MFASLVQPFEIINFGVSGYGTAQELQILRHRVWDYSPDMIILAFLTGNDVRNNSRALQRDDRMPYFVHKGKDLVLDDSFLKWYESRQGAIARSYYAVLRHSCLLRGFKAARYALDRCRWARERKDLAVRGGFGEAGLHEIVYREPSDDTWRQRRATFMVVTLSNGDQVRVRRANARHRANR